jgi:hypothetical protein
MLFSGLGLGYAVRCKDSVSQEGQEGQGEGQTHNGPTTHKKSERQAETKRQQADREK